MDSNEVLCNVQSLLKERMISTGIPITLEVFDGNTYHIESIELRGNELVFEANIDFKKNEHIVDIEFKSIRDIY